MKKILSVFMAVLMILAMIPTVFAASAPAITATASKTQISVGDEITVTVRVPQNSKLCTLTYELTYNSSQFEVVAGSATLKNVFGAEAINTTKNGVVRYVGATSTSIADSAQVLFTVKFKAKASSGKISVSVTEAYTSTSSNSETNVTSAVASASTKSISFTAATPSTPSADYIVIRTPSRDTIKYKDGIVLHADTKATLPAGSRIEWTASNNNFKTEASSDGKSYTITSNSKGSTIFTATLYSSSGAVLEKETIEMTSKAGFFDKIIGFFRSLFRLTKVYGE